MLVLNLHAHVPPLQSNFTVSFFLPYRLHHHAPKPNNPDVYIQPSDAFTAFVAQARAAQGGELVLRLGGLQRNRGWDTRQLAHGTNTAD